MKKRVMMNLSEKDNHPANGRRYSLIIGCGSIHTASPKGTTNPIIPKAPVTVGPISTVTMLNNSCILPSMGWSITFTNTNGYDVTVNSYTVIFFDNSGEETGSEAAENTPFIIAAHNSYTDIENHSFGAPVPINSSSCRLSAWNGH